MCVCVSYLAKKKIEIKTKKQIKAYLSRHNQKKGGKKEKKITIKRNSENSELLVASRQRF